ncbi:host specificity factor TipJ family phage tail protein [Sporomusa sp.]|uniref:host specificity factor TipJ family phage tail protein n=1 Tax=Sporomusa sp. TaxID=2078658 RepID=UPI002C98DA61|nr:host specificity factor TipJ family phage tail protein [Sporomusa sp.]HWR42779.1 host specificity factor TipJ family phage tail protein [Sporomusa sp.]
MITITVLKNPFNHTDKEIHTCEHIPGKTAYEYVQPYIMGLDQFVVSIGGNVVENVEQLVNDDDWIAVCPVVGKSGKDWFRAIGMLALGAAVTGWSSSWASNWGGVNGVFGSAANFWARMAAGAVTAVGGTLINHWFPAAKADRKTYEVNPSYNWSNAQPLTDQGNPLAVTYGTMRTAGQVLAQHVSSDGDKQYLNILLCGGEGTVDSISDIRINDNPISYYKDIDDPEIRLGTNDQTAIANFNDTYVDQALAYEINKDDTWTTHQTEGNAVEGLEITLGFPSGLYYAKDNGGLGNASVTMQAQYNKVGDSNWSNFTDGTDTSLDISAAKNTSFFRTYRVDNLPAAQYEVRVKCIAKSGTNNRYSTRVFWTQLSNIIYDDFARPGKVLIGVKALATNQLSGGMPNITWLQTRNKVWVWNADSGRYEQKSATNPAWAAYDMIHRCRQIKNIHTGNLEFVVKGTPASRAVYQDFARWAAFCDSRNLTFNYIFNTATDLWTALQKPEGVGRGKVIMRGTRYGCVCDAPGEPVQLFTVGNILTDKFKESFVGLKDRANAIEITFANKDKAYQKEVITAYADDYDSTTEPNITQITLDGATTVDQAYREGKYRLRLNQYLQRTVEHSADIDAIACQINDVVLLAHDVPQWGYSGRLLAATATTLQLDREVTLEPGKFYAVAVQITNPAATTAQDAQSIVTVGVQGVVNEISTDTVTLTSPLSRVPQKWDLYSFGETSKVVKPFRVLSISRDQDLRRKISCIEYIEEVYTEATDIPEVNYSALETTTEVSSVSVAEETYRQKDGTMVSNLNVAWSIPRDKLVSGYKVLYSSDNGQTWSEWATGLTALSTQIIGVKTQTAYLVKVCTISYVGVVSNGVVSFPVYVTGKDTPPSGVAGLSANISPSDCTKITLTWPAVPDIDLRGYQLMEGSTVLTPTPISDTQYIYTATQSRDHNFSVRAIDNSGNPSEIPATKSISITVEPAEVARFSVAIQETDRSKLLLSWAANSETDIAYYEIRTGNDGWDTGTVIATQLKAISYLHQLTTEGSQTFMIKAVNNAGNYSTNPANFSDTTTLKPNAPTNGRYEASATNPSILTISWDKISDKDLEFYEIKIGTDWSTGTDYKTTKETSVKYTFTVSTDYKIMVRSKNFAGYYSNVLNIPVSVSVEPDDITNFTVTQLDTDRRVLKFNWDAVANTTYEIRRGVDWTNSQLVGKDIQTNYFDYITTISGTLNFMIKAKNTAGFYSQGYAYVEADIILIPSIPSGASAYQDFTNKANLIVSWTPVSDADFLEYQVKVGTNWSTATTLTPTKESKITYTAPSDGTYTFLIKTKSVGGYYSSALVLTATVTINPSDVTGFAVTQNSLDRRIVNFVWNASTDSDHAYYVLKKGVNWDTATPIQSNITTNSYSLTASAEGTETYLLKAVNKAGKYSVAEAKVITAISLKPSVVTNLVATQNSQDKTKIDISWDASTDSDFYTFELVINSTTVTTKNNEYQYSVSSSGTYTIAIRSKTVGGYYSTATYFTIAATVEPQDITGFAVSQSLLDRSKLILVWDKPSELDVSYVELRQGSTWDSGTVLETRLTGTTYTTTINTESRVTFWIKAVNLAGKYSQNAVSTPSIVFNLNPTAPSGLTVTQDSTERSNIFVSWTGNGEYDFYENELRIGDTWETASIIKTTKENTLTFNPTSSGDYKLMLKSKNTAGFYSDEIFTHYYVTLEPSSVTGFQVIQNGEYVALAWDKSSDADVVGYRITEGASYDSGTLITDGTTVTNYETKTDTEREYKFHIKAINRCGNYSQSSTTASITVKNLPPKNVILSYDEISLQSGTHTNTEFKTSLINASNLGGKASDYPNTKASEVGGQTVLKLKQRPNVCTIDSESGTIGSDATGKTITWSTEYAYYGSKSLKITYSAGTRNVYCQAFDTTTSTEWTASFVVRRSDGGAISGVGVYLYSVNGGNTLISNPTITSLANGWYLITAAKTQATAGKMSLTGLYNLNQDTTYYLDGWKVEPGSIYNAFGTYYPSGTYLCKTKDVGQVITANIATVFYPTNNLSVVDGIGVGGNAKLQYCTSQDGTTYTDWLDFKPVLATFRYVMFRVVLTTTDVTKTPEVNKLNINIDVPDTTKTGTATIPVGGLTISYNNTYWEYPAVIAHAIGAGIRAEITTVNKDSFVVQVLNMSNVDVGGKISWQAIGY